MPYYEIETDVVARAFVKAESFADAAKKMCDRCKIKEENICRIVRWHFNEVVLD